MKIKIALIAISCLLLGCRNESDISVTVVNADSLKMDSVRVTVTGNSYLLGTLQPGDSVSTKVHPKGESQLEIFMQNPEVGKKSYIVGTYFETGYSGYYRVIINTDSIISVTDSISIR